MRSWPGSVAQASGSRSTRSTCAPTSSRSRGCQPLCAGRSGDHLRGGRGGTRCPRPPADLTSGSSAARQSASWRLRLCTAGRGAIENARAVGNAVIGPRLRELAASSPIVGEVRGRGVFWAVELVADRDAGARFRRPRRLDQGRPAHAGLLAFTAKNRLHVVPPAVIGETDAARGLDLISEVIDHDGRKARSPMDLFRPLDVLAVDLPMVEVTPGAGDHRKPAHGPAGLLDVFGVEIGVGDDRGGMRDVEIDEVFVGARGRGDGGPARGRGGSERIELRAG